MFTKCRLHEGRRKKVLEPGPTTCQIASPKADLRPKRDGPNQGRSRSIKVDQGQSSQRTLFCAQRPPKSAFPSESGNIAGQRWLFGCKETPEEEANREVLNLKAASSCKHMQVDAGSAFFTEKAFGVCVSFTQTKQGRVCLGGDVA
jgi:hypothetical protein